MLNCLIVEDEPLAAGILEDYIRQAPFLRLAGKCGDAVYASEVLREHAVDVMFLDIHLPGLKGLDFLKTLPQPPQTILTTAYHEYALESYEFGVVDYLLKPIDFERFMRAVQKLRKPGSQQDLEVRPFHFFNANKKMVRVWLDEVLYVESLKEYVKLHLTEGRTVVTKCQLSDMELILGSKDFMRIHRSFIVALLRIDAFSSTAVHLGDRELPIGRQYRQAVLDALKISP